MRIEAAARRRDGVDRDRGVGREVVLIADYRKALGDAVNQIQDMAASTLPATINLAFQGTAQAFQDSLRGLGLVLALSIVVIYIVLGVLYESFTHPPASRLPASVRC